MCSNLHDPTVLRTQSSFFHNAAKSSFLFLKILILLHYGRFQAVTSRARIITDCCGYNSLLFCLFLEVIMKKEFLLALTLMSFIAPHVMGAATVRVQYLQYNPAIHAGIVKSITSARFTLPMVAFIECPSCKDQFWHENENDQKNFACPTCNIEHTIILHRNPNTQ